MPNNISILTFHHVHPHRDDLTIPPELFEQALFSLSKRYHFISYETFKRVLFHGESIAEKSILITLDDGYLDNYLYAFPILKRMNIPAVIFAITGQIEISSVLRTQMPAFISHKDLDIHPRPDYFINTEEIAQMEQSGLIDIESHTVSHLACKGVSYQRILDEMEESFQFIQHYTRPKKRYGFCWPKGKYNDWALKAIKNSSYEFAFSTREGAFHKGDDLYKIQRIDCSSWNGNEKKYLTRLQRKLAIYSSPLISSIYTSYREYRIEYKRNKRKKQIPHA